MRFELDPQQQLVLLSADERPSLEEWFATFAEACGHPEYRPTFDFVFDRRKVAGSPESAVVREWMRLHAEFMREHGTGRLAIVVGEPVVFGMMRMASVFAEDVGVKLGVFWSVDEALAWLGRATPRTRS